MSSNQFAPIRRGMGVLAALAIIFLPFLSNGVFFPYGHFIVDLVLLSIQVIAIALLVFHRDFRSFALANEGLRYGDIAIGVLTLLYVIATFYAASLNFAVNGALDAIALLAVYAAMRLSRVRALFAPWLGVGFVVASVIINVIGMANGWGQLKFPSATETNPQGQIQIASVFQYHNAYAAFVASMAVGLIIWAARETVMWRRATAVGLAALNVSGLILSGSRGALAIWLVIMVIVAIGFRDASTDGPGHAARNRFFAATYVSLVGGGVGYELMHHAIKGGNAAYGWLGMVLAIAVPIALVVGRHLVMKDKVLLRGQRGLFGWIGIGGLIALVGGVIERHALVAKLASYHVKQMSVSQRFIFWGDGLHIFARNPVTGNGGGAWQAMYSSVQSYPYLSNKVHSYGMDILMEVGILGFLCLIALAWPMIRSVVWPSRKIASEPGFALRIAFVGAALMLLVHSLMDWDMSFEFLEILLYVAFGLAAAMTNPLRISARKPMWRGVGRVTTPVLGLLSVFGVVTIVGAMRSEAIAAQAPKQPANAVNLYRAAYGLSPYNAQYLFEAAMSSLNQQNLQKSTEQTAEQWIQSAESLDPYAANIAADSAQLGYNLGEFSFAFSQASRAFANAPYYPNYASLAIEAGTVDALQTASTNPADAKATFRQVDALYAKALRNKQVVDALPSYLPPLMPFKLQPFSIVSEAATKLVLGDATAAQTLAQSEARASDSHTADLAKLIVLMVKSGSQSSDVKAFVAGHSSVAGSYNLLVGALR